MQPTSDDSSERSDSSSESTPTATPPHKIGRVMPLDEWVAWFRERMTPPEPR